MTIASTFLTLTLAVALPLALVAAIFHGVKLKPRNGALIFFNIVAFGLIIGAFVNAIVGLALSSEAYTYYDSYFKRYSYVPESIHECSWVAMGLSIGAMALGLVVMLSTFGCIRSRRNRRLALQRKIEARRKATNEYTRELVAERNQPAPIRQPEPAKPTYNTDYIDEIKRLKELLDCDAITKEEYDAKKKEILSR